MRTALLLLSILFVLPAPSRAQEAGQVGVSMKAQRLPRVGIMWQMSESLALRASAYGEGRHDYVISEDSYMVDAAALFRFPIDSGLASYLGPHFTYSGYEETPFLGAVFGAQHQLHPRFGVFGEVGASVGLDAADTTLTFFNTGVGVVFYFNR